MTPDNFGRIIRAMRADGDENQVEEQLVHWMRVSRSDDTEEIRERLLNAGGAFYTVFSQRAMDFGKPHAYTMLLDAWVAMGIGYDRGVKGVEFADKAFEMYRVMTTHRI